MRHIFIFSLCVLVTSFSHAEILTTASLDPIAKEFTQADPETMVLLDIGGTLLAYCDPILHKSHEQWTKTWFEQNYPNLTKDETVALVRVVENTAESWRLVDTHWSQTIAIAQNRGAKVLAFTKVLGLKGNRTKQLAAFGLHLTDDLPNLASGTLYEYANGIIETEADLKGPVLEEVLSTLQHNPKKIIFVDDRIEQIRSVDALCQKYDIPCIAFHYTATVEVPELDITAAEYQLHTLVNKHTWISAQEAKALLPSR